MDKTVNNPLKAIRKYILKVLFSPSFGGSDLK